MAVAKKQPRRKVRHPRSPAAPPPAERERLICDLELQLTRARLREEELRREQGASEKLSQYYSRLFNSAPVGYVVLNGVGRILEINQAGAALLRWTREQTVNELFTRFVPKDALVDFLNQLHLAKSSRKQTVMELVLRTHGGIPVPVELVIAPFEGLDRVTHYRAAIIDITERQLVRRALQTTQQNYRDLVDSVEGIVWERNAVAREFTFVGPAGREHPGVPVGTLAARADFWQNRIHVDDRERVLEAHRQGIGAMRDFVIEFRMLTAERRAIWLRNSVTVTRDARGAVRLRGVMVNITELKEAEEALREETRMLETLNRIGTSLTAELDISNLIQLVTEAGKEVTGAEFGAFYHNHANGNGEKISLHALGAPSEIFERLPLPQHRVLAPASETEREAIRIDDLLHDPRNPKRPSQSKATRAAPVIRSYLAIPIASRRGEALGGLVFGHSKPGAFTERAQHLLAGIAAEAGIALDNARLHETVSKSESRFRELADAMPQIVWTARPDGQVDSFNRRWHEFTGLPEGGLNEGWLPFLHEEEGARCAGAWRNAVATGEPFEAECRLKAGKTGKHRWHLIRAVPIRDEHGRIIRWFGTATDIDDQKRAEGEVRDLNAALERRVSERTAQLQASNQELEAFSYSVSHDLRGPLRSIDAFSQLVRDDCGEQLGEQGKQYLGIVVEASHQMSRLIDDLLHLSRVTRTQMRRGPVDLGAIAGEIIAGLRRCEPARRVEVVIAPDLRAGGDERLLRIAMENLLNNAWKFTGRGEPEARIEAGMETREGEPVFFVRDNGAGFDMAFANKLFGAFQRLHTNSEFPGHGVGLATVQRIITRHGGRIWADAAVGCGATFYFTLPNDHATLA